MISLREARALLDGARGVTRLRAIGVALGFDGAALPLAPEIARDLGLDTSAGPFYVTRGPGSLRLLIATSETTQSIRRVISTAAAALARSSPGLSWMLLGCQGSELALGVLDTSGSGGRVHALTVDTHHVREGDLETLSSLAAAAAGDVDVLTHTRWREILGREVIGRSFYATLRSAVAGVADGLPGRITPVESRELALLLVSRLLFLAFVQSKGWLAGDPSFLESWFARSADGSSAAYRRMLEPLFFGTLNTPVHRRARRARDFGRVPYLNGGLFARTPLEKRWRRVLPTDDSLEPVFSRLIGGYRFTPREDSSSWIELAIDPEILGRAFESLMDEGLRRRTGTYYTPATLVAEVCDPALVAALSANDSESVAITALMTGVPSQAPADLGERVKRLRVLDPACGSGAFLLHALERLATLRTASAPGDGPDLRRSILASSIFGVDASPTAVWLCELRLWLAIVTAHADEDFMRLPALPNLDRNVRVGDSLASNAFVAGSGGEGRKIALLRQRYARASGARKRTLAGSLDALERRRAVSSLDSRICTLRARRLELLAAVRSRDLFGQRHMPAADVRAALAGFRRDERAARTHRATVLRGGALPFAFDTHFGDASVVGGFDVIVGNPPWIRPHALSPQARAELHKAFRSARSATWRAGAAAAGAGAGFGGQADVAAMFTERAVQLARENGVISLLLPAKLWKTLAGGGIRAVLSADTDLVRLVEFGSHSRSFDAATYPSIITVKRRGARPAVGHSGAVVLKSRSADAEWPATYSRLAIADEESPWLLLPPRARRAWELLRSKGTPLAASALGRPILGVKCGCNSAFVVRVLERRGDISLVASGERRGEVESVLLRPLLRGETAACWTNSRVRDSIVWTHDEAGQPLSRLPPAAQAWLSQWRSTLERRADACHAGAWWQLFRTRAARNAGWRVVWNDIGRSPRASLVRPGDRLVPLNTCYVITTQSEVNACALAAILNSPVATAWLNALAEPALNGFKRYFGWTMALLPIPDLSSPSWRALADLGSRAMDGDSPTPSALDDAVLSSFRVGRRDVAPLVEWLAASG